MFLRADDLPALAIAELVPADRDRVLRQAYEDVPRGPVFIDPASFSEVVRLAALRMSQRARSAEERS